MRLYLIRHGETDLNKQKILQGQGDFELNDYGRELARMTGKGLQDIPFDMVYTSPLMRAAETAELILKENQYAKSGIPTIVDKRIQEINFGEFEGLCYHPEHNNIPDKTFMNFFQNPARYQVPPGGEGFQEVMERTGDFLQELIQNKELCDKTILVSTHGCALKAMLAVVRRTPIELFWGEGVHRNCAVSLLEVQDGKIVVLEEGKIYY